MGTFEHLRAALVCGTSYVQALLKNATVAALHIAVVGCLCLAEYSATDFR